jgi:hypothetical protein
MLHPVPDSLRAASPHYHSLVQHAASPEASHGATLVTFTGMAKPQLLSHARQFAAAANRTLFEIDLSGVVSKYIGETEKNLDHLFQRAQQNSAILLFDEAEALFGTRTSVKDAHDRYANLPPDLLLQRLSKYRGTAVLLDPVPRPKPAHRHRIRHVAVHFPP